VKAAAAKHRSENKRQKKKKESRKSAKIIKENSERNLAMYQ